jgi:hypothetical protein
MATIDKLTHFHNFNTDFTDSIGSKDGTPAGTVINTSTPLVGAGSADLDGNNDDIDFGLGTAFLPAGARSISFWFKLKSAKQQYLVSCNNPEMVVWIDNVASRLYVDGSTGAAYIPFTHNTNKHHLVFTDDNAGNYTAYLDNSLKSLTPFGNLGSQANFKVGKGVTAVFLDSLFDAMAIGDSVFDASDVSFLWNGGAGIEIPLPTVAAQKFAGMFGIGRLGLR